MYYNMARVKLTVAENLGEAARIRLQAEKERRETELAIESERWRWKN